jgi:hypothetical protein
VDATLDWLLVNGPTVCARLIFERPPTGIGDPEASERRSASRTQKYNRSLSGHPPRRGPRGPLDRVAGVGARPRNCVRVRTAWWRTVLWWQAVPRRGAITGWRPVSVR